MEGGTVLGAASSEEEVNLAQSDAFKLMALVRAFMTHGHLESDVDPLQLDTVYAELTEKYGRPTDEMRVLLDHKFYGFTDADLDRVFYVDLASLGGLLSKKKEWTIRELIDAFRTAYCRKIGVEYMHIPHTDHCKWIRNKFELDQFGTPSKEKKLHILDRLLWADEFASFLTTKFGNAKRFGLEGCEAFIPGMKACMDKLVELDASKCIIGMPHRGRLNMLVNVVRKPLETVFAEFQGVMPVNDEEADWHAHSGDVKYHLGTNYTRTYPNGKKMTCEILANPSHLECVNPVVMGKVRAE